MAATTTLGSGRLVVVTGLPGSGKTTLAVALAESMPACRMCPDDWMMASGIDLWNAPARARIEAVQLDLTLDLLRGGTNVVIEWGVWTRAERDELRDAARSIGAPVELRHVSANTDELWRRIVERDLEGRWASRSIERHELDEWAGIYEAPTIEEIATYDGGREPLTLPRGSGSQQGTSPIPGRTSRRLPESTVPGRRTAVIQRFRAADGEVDMRALAMLIGAAMCATACGGASSGAGEVDDGPQATTSESPAALVLTGPDFDQTVVQAGRLVDRLGDDAVATDALLFAAERGYSGPQILTGVESADLQADGRIDGVSPDASPLGRIEVSEVPAEESRRTQPLKRPRTQASKAHVRQDDGTGDKLVIDMLRSAAAAGLGADDREFLIGLEGVVLILVFLEEGFTPEQVIEALVLGVYFYEQGGVCYSQTLPVIHNEPEPRPCDEQLASEPQPSTDDSRAEPPSDTAVVDGATYEGDLAAIVDADSRISVTVSADGSISGALSATESLDNYLASVELCGVVGDDEDCDDSIVECPATVQWESDLGSLEFVGTPPDDGTVSGTITITLATTPQGCGEPSTDTQTLEIAATVTPEGAQITDPFLIDLERVESGS